MTDFKPGDVLLIGAECSVQFAGDRALRLRLASVDQRPTYHGWVWLTGYVLNKRGEATDKRELYVRRAGIEVAERRPAPTLVGWKTPAQRPARRIRAASV